MDAADPPGWPQRQVEPNRGIVHLGRGARLARLRQVGLRQVGPGWGFTPGCQVGGARLAPGWLQEFLSPRELITLDAPALMTMLVTHWP